MAFSTSTIDVDGCSIAVHRGGKGEPLLYLHGTDGLAEWPAALDRLAERHDVIAPDHPGFGDSAAPDWLDEAADAAYLYLDLLEQLGLTGVHLVGESLGGWIALEMAVRSTERLRSLTLIASAGIHVKGVTKTDIFMIDPDEQARLAYADATLGEAAAERALVARHQETALRNRMASARMGWHPRFFNPRLQRWLCRVRVPTHIIWGDQDRIIPPAYAEAFHAAIPGSTLTMIPETGHLPLMEKPDRVLDAMQGFMARLN